MSCERKIFIGVFCLLLSLSFAGCRNQNANPYLPYENILDKEPNNSFDTAQLLKIATSMHIAGFYDNSDDNGRPDSDYYHVLLGNSGCAYKMTLTSVPGVDGKLAVYSADYELLFEINERAVGEAEVVWDYYCRYPEIYIVVSSCDAANTNVPYMLNITADNHERTTETEPNNEEKNATVLTSVFPIKAYTVPNDDIDCYRLEFEGLTCDFRVKVESFSNMDVSLTLAKNISTQIADSSSDVEYIRKSCTINQGGWGSSEMSQYFSSAGGEFYAYVSADVQGTLKEPVYYITLETLADGSYEREFNNCRSDATVILPQEEMTGELDPADTDWFYFDVLSNGTRVEVSLEGMSDKRFTLDIEHSDGTNIYSEKGSSNLSLRDLNSGRYYLILRQDEKIGVKNRYRLFINTYSG